MIPLIRSSRLVAAVAAVLMCVAGDVAARIGPYGTGSVELITYDLGTGRFEFLIQVVPDIDVERGELLAFHRVGIDGPPADSAILWSGPIVRGDTVSATYTTTFPGEGWYEVAGEIIIPEDPREGLRSICGSCLFLGIRPSGVLTSGLDFRYIAWQRMQTDVASYASELRERGIHTLDLDSLQSLAPDVFDRLSASSGYSDFTTSPPGWSAKGQRVIPHSGPTRYIHGNDSASYPVTKPGYHGGPSDAIEKPIPERVRNRPKNPTPLPPKAADLPQIKPTDARPAQPPPPTPVSDSALQSDSLLHLRSSPRATSNDSTACMIRT